MNNMNDMNETHINTQSNNHYVCNTYNIITQPNDHKKNIYIYTHINKYT